MKWLVTGGAGFIGSNFVFYMLDKYPEDQIICLDKLTYAGNLETLEGVMENPGFTFVKGDIADREAVYALFEKERPDIVVNFAAESHVDRSVVDPGIFLQTNILGTGVLMDACRKYGIQRYHQVSTDEVYGDLPLTAPTFFYGRDSDPYLQSVFRVQGFGRSAGTGVSPHLWAAVSISAVPITTAPTISRKKLIPLMIANALNDKPLPVYGSWRERPRLAVCH